MTQSSGGGFYSSEWLDSRLLHVIFQVLHIFSAVILIGVPFVVRYVAIPNVDGATAEEIVKDFYSVWPLIVAVVLFMSGFFNFMFANRGSGNTFLGSFFSRFGIAVIIKIALLLIIDVISIGLGTSEDMRADHEMWLITLMTLGLVALIIATVLHRGNLEIKSNSQ
jgi:hypothetical protein